MISRLQMKLKDKIGVAGIFALGFFVVIASSTSSPSPFPSYHANNPTQVIRAYYSKKNETMLTCTVSMIETAIAIIATCLPALRSMVLGTNTTKGDSKSYGKHYELSSARRKAQLHSSSVTGGAHSSRVRTNGSEDSLFSPVVDGEPGKIKVDTQIETSFEDGVSTAESAEAKVKSAFGR
jgi:hypothetical protein